MIGWIYLIVTTGILIFIATRVAMDRPLKRYRWIGWATLANLWTMTALLLGIRFIKGMGAVTNMTDINPWGVWVGLLQAGVALSAGGFLMAATVHIFHIKRFEPVLKPMVLTAFLGYSFVASTLFIEVGRPYQLWHPLVMWQHHSIMFEVAWCVTLYMTVLFVEFSPVIFERLKMGRAVKFLHAAAIPIVIVGVILSTLHQSSMGSMFLITPQKIHPVWYSPLLPVFFFVSCAAVGLCVTIVESFYADKIFKQELDHGLLMNLGRAASFFLFLYIGIRVIDITARGAWGSLAGHPFLAAELFLELVVGGIIPAILLLWKPVLVNRGRLFLACLPVLIGIVFNRLTVSWFAMVPYTGPGYFPTWMELAISLTVFTVLVVMFGLAVRFLPVFPKEEETARQLN